MFLSLKHNHRPLLIAITVAVVVVLVVFGFGTHAVQADTLTDIWNVVSHPVQSFILGIAWLVYGLVWMGGQILGVVIVILIWVASYNNFINERIVNVGWVLVRDLANMVFIIALLYMAFNMVFGIRGKGASLLTLIINAGLINFSKMIAGLLIDVSQVVMLTFVHGFYNIAAGNLLDAFGLTGMISMKAVTGDVLGGSQTAGAITILITILFALIMVYVAVGVVFTIIVVLLGRVFELWGLIIFSPMPYVGKFIPGLAQFTGQWWSRLSKALIVGPILAFFLWLSFTAVTLYSSGSKGLEDAFGPVPEGRESYQVGATGDDLTKLGASGAAVGLAEAGSVKNIMAFIIMVGLLMMSLKYAQQFGAAGSDIAARWRGKAHKWTMGKLKTARKRFVDEPLEARHQFWAQKMPLYRRFFTKEGKAEAKNIRGAKRLGKLWEREHEGRKIGIPGVKPGTKLGGIPLKSGGGWKTFGKPEDEKEKMRKRAEAARANIVFSRYTQNAEELQKRLEKVQGYDVMDVPQLRSRLEEVLKKRKSPENIQEAIATMNIISKKGGWEVKDDLLYKAGDMVGGIGSHEHMLLGAKVEKDSEEALGKARAGAISAIRVDPVTKGIVDLNKLPVTLEGTEIKIAEDADRYMIKKIAKDIGIRGFSSALNEFNKGQERSVLRNESVKEKYDEKTGIKRPLTSEEEAKLHKKMQVELGGIIRGLNEAAGKGDLSKVSLQAFSKDYGLRRLHETLGEELIGEFIQNLENYVKELGNNLKPLKLTPEAKLALNNFYRRLTFDPTAKLVAEEGDAVSEKPVKGGEHRTWQQLQDAARAEAEGERQRREEVKERKKQKDRSREAAEEVGESEIRERSLSDSGSRLVDSINTLHAAMEKYANSLTKLHQDSKDPETIGKLHEIEKLLAKTRVDRRRGVSESVDHPDYLEGKKIAISTLQTLKASLNTLKDTDDSLKPPPTATGGGFTGTLDVEEEEEET